MRHWGDGLANSSRVAAPPSRKPLRPAVAPQCRFGTWLHEAALQRAPDDAPWRRWKADAQTAAVAQLLGPQCATDARRFKRLLKVFCGGKKKGSQVEQPARGGS